MSVWVTLHLLPTAGLGAHADELRVRIAPRYRAASLTGPNNRRLEELGAGLLLAEVLGVTHDEDLLLGPWGKPALAAGGTPHFNLSHDAGLVVLACAEEELGVDVMGVPEDPLSASQLRVARRFFSQEELEQIDEGASEAERLAFCRAWTRREAALKAQGTGLAEGAFRDSGALAGWAVRFLRASGTVIAVATRDEPEITLVPHALA